MRIARKYPTPVDSSADFSNDSGAQPAFFVADLRAARAAPNPSLKSPRPERLNDAADPVGATISQPLIIGALALFDHLTFILAGLLAYFSLIPPFAADWGLLAASLIGVTAVGVYVLSRRWTYTIRAIGNFPRQSLSLAVAFVAALALWDTACVMAGATEPDILRNWTERWFAWGWGGGAAIRALFAGLVALWTRQGRLARRTVVVGGGAQAMETIRRLENSGRGALQILGIFDDRDRARLPADAGRYKLLGAFADLEIFCRDNKVDLLIVAFPLHAEDRILQILAKLWVLPVDVRISALGSKLTLRDRVYHFIGDVPFLPVFDKPMSDWDIAIKAAFDRLASALLIILLSPVLVLLALGVKLSSPGPALFVQKRYGFNNEHFGVFKFRSMYTDLCDPQASKLVTRDDPRVTPFGAFIRRTSLDELPQLFNVFRGDLSLVGPRPHALKGKVADVTYEQVVEGYFARHRVKPGITGWAQVNGWRGETDTAEKIEQRVAHDLYYIENWSLWLDIKILLKTPISVVIGKNAF